MLRDCIFESYIANEELAKRVSNLNKRYQKNYKFAGHNDLIMMFNMHKDQLCISVYKGTTSWHVCVIDDGEICFQYASDDETKRIRMQYLEDHNEEYIEKLITSLLNKVEEEVTDIIEDKLENYFEELKSEFTE